jgi:peroxin-5
VEADSNNLEALLELGVSYTNELHQAQALGFLKQWLERHPRYSSLKLDVQSEEELVRTSTRHGEVTALFLEAARIAPDDADIHTVLGVLYNLSREYDKAIHAFQTAITLKPDDYSLWNKLGATQANSFRSKEAGTPPLCWACAGRADAARQWRRMRGRWT